MAMQRADRRAMPRGSPGPSRRRARAGASQVALPVLSSHGSSRAAHSVAGDHRASQRRRRGDAACRSPRPPPGHAGELEPVHARSRCRPDHRADHCERAHSAAGDRRAPHRRRRRTMQRADRHATGHARELEPVRARSRCRSDHRADHRERAHSAAAIAAHTASSPTAHAPMPMQHADRHATWSRRRARAGARQVALPVGSSHGSPRASPQRCRQSPRTPHRRRSRTPRCRCSMPIATPPGHAGELEPVRARSRCRSDHRTDHRERAHSVAGDRRARRIVADRARPMPMQRADRHATWSRRRARAGARQVALPAGSSHGSPRASPQRRRQSPRTPHCRRSRTPRCRCSMPIATPPGHAGELEPVRARSRCRPDHRTDHRERAHSVAGDHRASHRRRRRDGDAACRSPRHLVTPARSSRCTPGRAAGRIIARITASKPTASPAITARRIVAGVAMQRADRRGRHLVTPASSSRCTPGRAAGRIIARIIASEPTAPPAIAARRIVAGRACRCSLPQLEPARAWSPCRSDHRADHRERAHSVAGDRRAHSPRCRCSVPIATPPGHAGELEPVHARSRCRRIIAADHRERSETASSAMNRRAHRMAHDRERRDADAASNAHACRKNASMMIASEPDWSAIAASSRA